MRRRLLDGPPRASFRAASHSHCLFRFIETKTCQFPMFSFYMIHVTSSHSNPTQTHHSRISFYRTTKISKVVLNFVPSALAIFRRTTRRFQHFKVLLTFPQTRSLMRMKLLWHSVETTAETVFVKHDVKVCINFV